MRALPLKFRTVLAIAAIVVTGAGVTGGIATTAGATTARSAASAAEPTEPGGTLSSAFPLGGLGALGAKGARIGGLSCASPGNCAAVGSYDVGGGLPFTADEVAGVWQSARAVPGIKGLVGTGGQGRLDAVSCWAAGDCAAAGWFESGQDKSTDGLVVLEQNGTWGKAHMIGVYGGQLTVVSCSAGGYCAAAGTAGQVHSGKRLPLAVAESKGTWGPPRTFALPTEIARPGNVITSVSCPAAGDCLAVGESYTEIGGTGASANVSQGILLQQIKGSWAVFAVEIPGLATLHAKRTTAESISCPSAGDCTVVGRTATATSSGSFLAVESNGTWLPPTPLPAQSSGYQLSSVSCVTVPVRDTCYSTGSSTATAFTEESENSTAFAPGSVLGAAKLGNTGITENPAPVISCSVSAYCAVGGEYRGTTAGHQPFLDVKTALGWQYAIGLHGLPLLSGGKSDAEIDAVSCTAAGYCSGAGTYLSTAKVYEPFVVNLATQAMVHLSVVNTGLTYGKEQAGHVTVQLTSPKGTPTGKVDITAGRTTVCIIKAVHGTGSCHLTAKQLKPGGYLFHATYRIGRLHPRAFGHHRGRGGEVRRTAFAAISAWTVRRRQ